MCDCEQQNNQEPVLEQPKLGEKTNTTRRAFLKTAAVSLAATTYAINIGFNVNVRGERQDAYASVMEEVKNPARGGGVIWKATGITWLEDLTDKQLWILAQAKAIILSKDQAKAFSEKFYKKK